MMELSIKALIRLVAVTGGLWMMLLLAVVEPWASSHMFRWWALNLLDVSGTLCLLVGAIAVMSRRKLFSFLTLFGACSVASLGFISFVTQGEHSSASLQFSLAFFVLTVSVPLFVTVHCVYELMRLRSAGGPA
jgi:hypothetical protein